MTPLRCFIGYDVRQPVAFQVAAHSLWENASRPVSITRLDLRGMPIQRRGLTEFTYSRFLVPWLSDFEGYSLFLDSDMLVRGDVAELFDIMKDSEAPVGIVVGSRKFEWPSVMLFNNSKCRTLTPEFVDSARLYDFGWTPIAENFPPEWNHLVGYDKPDENAKIVHFTQGIPVWHLTKDCEFAEEWKLCKQRSESTVSFQELMGQSVHVPFMNGRKA